MKLDLGLFTQETRREAGKIFLEYDWPGVERYYPEMYKYIAKASAHQNAYSNNYAAAYKAAESVNNLELCYGLGLKQSVLQCASHAGGKRDSWTSHKKDTKHVQDELPIPENNSKSNGRVHDDNRSFEAFCITFIEEFGYLADAEKLSKLAQRSLSFVVRELAKPGFLGGSYILTPSARGFEVEKRPNLSQEMIAATKEMEAIKEEQKRLDSRIIEVQKMLDSYMGKAGKS